MKQKTDPPPEPLDPDTELTLETMTLKLNFAQMTTSVSPERVLWWADALARAEQERLEADLYYRQWRARESDAIADAKHRMPEHKIRAKLEGSPMFRDLKLAMARAERNCTMLREVVPMLSMLLDHKLATRDEHAHAEGDGYSLTFPRRKRKAKAD